MKLFYLRFRSQANPCWHKTSCFLKHGDCLQSPWAAQHLSVSFGFFTSQLQAETSVSLTVGWISCLNTCCLLNYRGQTICQSTRRDQAMNSMNNLKQNCQSVLKLTSAESIAAGCHWLLTSLRCRCELLVSHSKHLMNYRELKKEKARSCIYLKKW